MTSTVLLVERELPFVLRRDRISWLQGALRRVASENPGAEILVTPESWPLLDPVAARAAGARPLEGSLRQAAGAARRSYLLYTTLNRMLLLRTELALLLGGSRPVALEPAPLRERIRNSPFLKSGTHGERRGALDVCVVLDSYADKASAFDPREVLDPADFLVEPMGWRRLAPFYLFSRVRKMALARVLFRRVAYHALLLFWAVLERVRNARLFSIPELAEDRAVFGTYLDRFFHFGGRVIRGATEGRHFSRLEIRHPSVEIGVDDGEMSILHFRGRRITVGVEYDPAVIMDAQERVRATFEHPLAGGDLYRLPFREGAFRTVLLVHIMDHMERIEGVIAELSRVTAPGGTLAFSSLSEHYYLLTLAERWLRPLGAGRWLDRRRENHLRLCRIYNLLTKEEWAALLERHGLVLEEHRYFSSAPLSRRDTYLSQELGHSIGQLAASSVVDTRYTRWLKRMMTWFYLPYYLRDEEMCLKEGGMNMFIVARKPGHDPAEMPSWPELLACPGCRGGLDEEQDFLRCTVCGKRYPVIGGIPVVGSS